ncbi:hypothetical protein [Oscillatoria sp. FACHB-1406]|uniref:hypothetical protein n=1 Tax=Oscillatoria sp. FACHB-1406 TaxID=2692846 RepID=UPI0016831E68|nr:hypothetical protein [Oscillatoria sp. FACHB-1406]MBD2578137.1 hypothetical protein [Oscillatoria sp. FACHB-1406]
MNILKLLALKTLQFVLLTLLFVLPASGIALAEETASPQAPPDKTVEEVVPLKPTNELPTRPEIAPKEENKPLATPSTRRPTARPYDYNAIDRFTTELYGEGEGN